MRQFVPARRLYPPSANYIAESSTRAFWSTCNVEGTDDPDVMKMPVSVLECLGRLAAKLEQSDVEAIMLPLALPWAQENT